MNRVIQTVFICLSFTFSALTSADNSDDAVVVSLSPGQQLKGFRGTSVKGDNVYTFYGIPYAAPPLGDKRFKPPQPAPVWSGARDASKKSAICLQVTLEDTTSERSEDCLYLNVFSPHLNGSLPVLVWIHGGGFTSGSAFNDGDGATMSPKGIVTVTINYRLGAFGFLSTGDSILPGNYGMLDQVLALQWVQKNIKVFGGDPSQVTIGGESAGSMSVSLLIVSPLATGLFNRAILESGSAFSQGIVRNPSEDKNYKQSAIQSAGRVGCGQATSLELLQCLQKVDAKQLFNATPQLNAWPKVEKTYGFLPDDPTKLVKDGKYNRVDTLQGRNSGEFSWSFQDPGNDGFTRQEFIDNVRSQLARTVKTDLESLLRDFVQAYLGNVTDPFVIRDSLIQASADILFGGGTLVEINNFLKDPSANSTKHFLYEFDYRVSDTLSPVWQAIYHAAERRFVFYPDSRYKYTTADDRAVGEAVQTYWANFIKYGDPTPANKPESAGLVQWAPFTKTSPSLLKIDAVSRLVPYPRPSLFALFERALELSKIDSDKTIVG